MEPLVSIGAFVRLLNIIVALCFTAGVVGSFWFKRRANRAGFVLSTSVIVVSTAVFLLWHFMQYFTGVFGLDSVSGLGIMAVVFCLVGVGSAALITVLFKSVG